MLHVLKKLKKRESCVVSDPNCMELQCEMLLYITVIRGLAPRKERSRGRLGVTKIQAVVTGVARVVGEGLVVFCQKRKKIRTVIPYTRMST